MADHALAQRLAAARLDWIVPQWPAPPNVHALSTTRNCGGNGEIDFAPGSAGIAAARSMLRRFVPREPVWLAQHHGTVVVSADGTPSSAVRADGSVARFAGNVCAVLAADCLPVLFTARDGSVVAAAHAGWRGLASGVLEAALAAMDIPAAATLAWLGPAIGPDAFEVGDEVVTAFCDADASASTCFIAGRAGKWHADLYALARRRLMRAGVSAIYGEASCTFRQRDAFYSYRRGGDDAARRMATVIWRDEV
jgi:polyphenol oxidase